MTFKVSKTGTSSIRAVAREAGVDEKRVREWKGQEMELEEMMQKQGKMVCKVRKRIRGGGRIYSFGILYVKYRILYILYVNFTLHVYVNQ